MYSRHRKVDVLADMLREMIFVARDANASILVLIHVVLSVEKALDFLDGRVEFDPIATRCVADPVSRDAGVNEPDLNPFDGMPGWCEHVSDLVSRPVLAYKTNQLSFLWCPSLG
jgi:hypothetical protein